MLSDQRLRELAERSGVRGSTAVRGSTSRGRRWTGVCGCLFRAVLLCAHALHAHAGRWVVNEKGAVSAVGQLPESLPDFAARAHAIC